MEAVSPLPVLAALRAARRAAPIFLWCERLSSPIGEEIGDLSFAQQIPHALKDSLLMQPNYLFV